jgi:cold shock protein
MARETGTIRRFDRERGFGVIERDSGSPEVVVQRAGRLESGSAPLDPGERVEFEVVERDRGPTAEKLVRARDRNRDRSSALDPRDRGGPGDYDNSW